MIGFVRGSDARETLSGAQVEQRREEGERSRRRGKRGRFVEVRSSPRQKRRWKSRDGGGEVV